MECCVHYRRGAGESHHCALITATFVWKQAAVNLGSRTCDKPAFKFVMFLLVLNSYQSPALSCGALDSDAYLEARTEGLLSWPWPSRDTRNDQDSCDPQTLNPCRSASLESSLTLFISPSLSPSPPPVGMS